MAVTKRTMFNVRSATVTACAILSALNSPLAVGQNTQVQTRIVNIDGGDMRVLTHGLEQRQPGKPVVVLEAGAGSGLEAWRPVFADITKRTPVVAYDRRGIGQSQPDTQRPTLRRVAASLHALLQRIGAGPPYVLVGHSWGGVFIRAFADALSTEVAGMVFIDASDIETSRVEKATVVPEAERAKTLAPPATGGAPTPSGPKAV